MDTNLIKQAYELGYQAGLQKEAANVKALGAKKLVELAMSPKFKRLVGKELVKKPSWLTSFFDPYATKQLVDAQNAANKAWSYMGNRYKGETFWDRLFRTRRARDAAFYHRLDEERLKRRMQQLIAAEDHDWAVKARRKIDKPVILQNLSRLQLLQAASRSSGVVPTHIPDNPVSAARQTDFNKFITAVNEIGKQWKESPEFLSEFSGEFAKRV